MKEKSNEWRRQQKKPIDVKRKEKMHVWIREDACLDLYIERLHD